jgi:hypothetical protein
MSMMSMYLRFNVINTYVYFRVLADLQLGKKRLSAKMLPRFLFPQDQALDEEDPEAGFFRGHIIIRVRHNLLL